MSQPALALNTLLQPDAAFAVPVDKRASCLVLTYEESVTTKLRSVSSTLVLLRWHSPLGRRRVWRNRGKKMSETAKSLDAQRWFSTAVYDSAYYESSVTAMFSGC
jgi:hypothetical protein